jgi:adenosylhomocysteine nucleosidase
MAIGIIAALEDEIADLVSSIVDSQTHRIGMRDFYVGTLEGQQCVVVLARIGKVAAAATTVTLIREFGVTEIVFSGVAGGLASHVNVGDIVLADRLIQHDLDARPIFPRHEIPLLRVTALESSARLRAELQSATHYFLSHELTQRVPQAVMQEFNLTAPQLHTGMIISGDQFIGLNQDADRLRQELPDACAVEMEGAAVAQICYEFDIPCAVIRTISDRADATAHIDFSAFLVKVASHYSSGIIRRFLSQRRC